MGWGADGVVDGAVVDDREQGPAAGWGQRLRDDQPQGDGVDPCRAVGAHGEVGVDPQPAGSKVVAGQEAAGVVGDAGGEAGDEQLGWGGALVAATLGQRLVADEPVAAHLKREPVPALVGDAEGGHRSHLRSVR